MKVWFKDWNLVDELGCEHLIEPIELLKYCCRSSYKSVRIADIISEGIKDYMGAELVKNNMIRENTLFNFLEQGINADERYQKCKKEQMERRKVILEKMLQERAKRHSLSFIDVARKKETRGYHIRDYSGLE